MLYSQPIGSDSSSNSSRNAAADAAANGPTNSKSSDEEDYNGDDSNNNSDNPNEHDSSDDDSPNRVVTFAETPKTHSSQEHTGDSAFASPPHVSPIFSHHPGGLRRTNLPGHAETSESPPNLYMRRHLRERLNRSKSGSPSSTKSHSDLERLKSELRNTLQPQPAPSNTPADGVFRHHRLDAGPASATVRGRHAAMQHGEYSESPPLHDASARRVSTTGDYDTTRSGGKGLHAFPTLSPIPFHSQQKQHHQHHPTPLRQQDTTAATSTSNLANTTTATTTTTTSTPASSGSSSEAENLTSPQRDGSDSSVLESIWFNRARTFSIDPTTNEGISRINTARSPDSIRSLPRILTMTSGKEKAGGDMEAGIDDLPPLRLGNEVTNDLRNIQLTFSIQPPHGKHGANPLKHLIRSKHNFRALVSYGGYLIPINILLNVILLGRGWLQYKNSDDNNTTSGSTVNNPVGYLITSIISLILIVTSGVCFVFRCLEYNVLVTTMISIVANFINAAIILVSAIMYVKNERPKHPDAKLTGEYYCSYAGAAVAFLDAVLLLLDVIITPGFRYRGSGMSRQQRVLQFNIILVVVWIGIGGYAWSKIEAWDTLTSVMFCMVTVTTIGFGNVSPTKMYSRLLQLFYGPIGILMFGLLLLNTRNVIIQITRSKFRSARREFEAKRKRIEQDVAVNQVKKRLAAQPPKRTWHAVVTDFFAKLFIPRRQRLRIGIPRWLNNILDRENNAVDSHSQVDLESGLRHERNSADARKLGIRKLSDAAPIDSLDAESEAQSRLPERQTESLDNRGNFARTGSIYATDDNHTNGSLKPLPRTYSTASRISQVRAALEKPGIVGRVRQRVSRRHKHQQPKTREEDSDDHSNVEDEEDTDDAGHHSDRFSVADKGDDNGSQEHGHSKNGNKQEKGKGFKRVLSTASAIHDKVRGKGKGQKKVQQKRFRDITKQLWAALALNICFWCMSAGIFYAFESSRWTYFDAMFFCYVAFTTIGYGDMVPESTEGMVAFICLCFVAVALETLLVVSAVTYFSELLGNTIRQTRVQKRIEKRRRSLIAYEIRRHIKHPNYNPFGAGDEDRVVNIGLTKLKRAMRHIGDIFKGKKSLKQTFTYQRSADQRHLDDQLTEGFIRHATGMGGFAPSGWQPPSPSVSPAHLPSTNNLEPLPPSFSLPTSPHPSLNSSSSPGTAAVSPRLAGRPDAAEPDSRSAYSSTSIHSEKR
ncbi:Potassium channel [Coemansia sp. RSA 1358]|uniref:Potassium channel n=1 Tax=Coemansia umbellata TaxID=1424467 RepID=A0ABQ8PEC1_9FUNG|nr:Potassium channel [Coemansia umbellata]KAJ2618919.1 Potassium channel [Coemansia sp. RSA 1358]